MCQGDRAEDLGMGWEKRAAASKHSSPPETGRKPRTTLLQDKSPHICFALVGSGALDMFLFILFNYQANISNGSTKFVTMVWLCAGPKEPV